MKKYIATYTVTYTAEFNDEEYAKAIDPIEHAEHLFKDCEVNLEGHEIKVEEIREDEYGAWLAQDESGRYVSQSGEYGYYAHFGGAWICYTCGHLCECEPETKECRNCGHDIWLNSSGVWVHADGDDSTVCELHATPVSEEL
jgi:rubrerythrin